VPLKTVRDSYQYGRQAYEAKLILVRPDRYVAWANDGGRVDAAAVMRKAVGR
jgi:4-hydroxyisophthalate hydroxylase